MQALVRRAVQASRPLPLAHGRLWGVDVIKNVPYAYQAPEQTLNIIRPKGRTDTLPVVIYVHGGGFHMMSKDTHWPITAVLARAGYLVVSVDYRLAPEHPYPVPLADTCAAVIWVQKNIATYGGDPERLAYAGDSAGGNLVASLAIAGCFPRSETYARALYEAAPAVKAVISACGIYQVSDPERFRRRRKVPGWVDKYLHVVCLNYLGGKALPEGGYSLADPLLLLEDSEYQSERPLPPFHLFCGTRDPLLDDTRRLATALRKRCVPVDAHLYPGGIHEFHIFAFQQIARQCWRRQLNFLSQHLALDTAARAQRSLSRNKRLTAGV